MAKKKKSVLPPVEVLIIGVFFLSFIAWAFKQCSDTKTELQGGNEDPTAEVSVPTTQETPPAAPPQQAVAPANNTPITTNPNVDLRTGQGSSNTTSSDRLTTTEVIRVTPLFVTIDGLNLRRGPSLDSAIIMKLPLHEQVGFMNEVTDSTSQISLGNEIANEPWVKVRHKGGRVGWVYGAGVHYYKRKRIIVE